MTIRIPETRNPRPNMTAHESRSYWRKRSQEMEQERNAALGQIKSYNRLPLLTIIRMRLKKQFGKEF